MPTASVAEAFKPVTENPGPVLIVHDIDGCLSALVNREGQKPDDNGIWPTDGVISRSYQSLLNQLSKRVVVALLTGGAGLRGVNMVSSVVADNKNRLVVVGNEGAEVWSRESQTIQVRDEFKDAAGAVQQLSEQIDALEIPGVIKEPKGDIATTYHFGYIEDPAQRNAAIEALSVFEAAAHELGIDGYLDTESNMAFTLRPKGLSKGSAIQQMVKEVEAQLGQPFGTVVFVGDGTTDLHAVQGLKALQSRCAANGQPFEVVTVAAMNNRSLSRELASQCDLVVRGAEVTPEMARGNRQACAEVGVDPDELSSLYVALSTALDRPFAPVVMTDLPDSIGATR